jgi:uncharacterized protein YabN with tetrapyrrole methylase and pyrophosphatase domain
MLLLPRKLQTTAAGVGFDWDRAAARRRQVKKRPPSLSSEMALVDGGPRGLAGEVGDLLFSVVNLAANSRWIPNLALRESGAALPGTVETAARSAGHDGLTFESMGLDEQEAYYQQAKKEQER